MASANTQSEVKPIAVIIPAAGFGKRTRQPIAKQFIRVGGKTILAHTLSAIQTWATDYHHTIRIMVALSEGATLPADVCSNVCSDVYSGVCGVETCIGGKERADSVANALAAIEKLGEFEWAMVHDAARPLIQASDIETLYQTLKDDAVGGLLAKKVTATVKRADNHEVLATIPREDLWLAQTPQLFRFDLLKQSLSGAREQLTDEASGIEAMGLRPKLVEGSRDNMKITTAEDLAYFEQYSQAKR